jgi:hypothetical protein
MRGHGVTVRKNKKRNLSRHRPSRFFRDGSHLAAAGERESARRPCRERQSCLTRSMLGVIA